MKRAFNKNNKKYKYLNKLIFLQVLRN